MATVTDDNAIETTVKTMWGIRIRTTLSRGLPINTAKSNFLIFASNKDGPLIARQMMHIGQKKYTDMGVTVTIAQSLKVLGAMVKFRNDFTQGAASRALALKEATALRQMVFKRDKITNNANRHYLNAL
eukprot:9495972-Pyramimonas_sp.AAC.1